MRTRRDTIGPALLCLVLLAGCNGCASSGGAGTVPPVPTAEQTMVQQQWTATNLIFYTRVARRQVALGVGELEGRGVITTAQADMVEPVGNAVDAIVDPLEQSLRLWMVVGDGDPALIREHSKQLREALVKLVVTATKLGVKVEVKP